jgi:hypothetical protein
MTEDRKPVAHLNDYDTLAEVFNDLEDEEPNTPTYKILSAKVYETARYGDHHIPHDEITSIATELNQGEVQSARSLVAEYLDPAESDVRGLE